MKFDVRFAQNDMRICVKLDSDDSRFSADFSDYQEVVKVGETYKGAYSVTPAIGMQTLPTAQKYMEKDLTVNGIPYYQTSNASNGETVYIGTEVEINGD